MKSLFPRSHGAPRCAASLGLLFCTAVTVAVRGQSDTQNEEVVVLSPFTVSDHRDVGYQASDTLAGTRIRTDLADVGSAISVVTKEFLRDLGATDNETLLAYTLNTEVGGPRGNFSGAATGPERADELGNFASPNSNNRIRGLTSADSTRNFFLTSVPWDGYNVSRVDLQRGPNAILFGLGSPGGVINGTTDAANFRGNAGEIAARFDQFGSFRGTLNYNHELLPDELAVRLAVLHEQRDFRQEPAFADDDRQYIAVAYRPRGLNSSETFFQISANYERTELDSNRPRSVTPLDFITPFFAPIAAGGQGGQTVNLFTYDTRQTLPGGAPNPNYTGNPWLASDFGVVGPRLIHDGRGSPYWRAGRLDTSGALNAAGVPQPQGGNTLIYGGPAFNALILESYPIYAQGEGLPYANVGGYVQRGISDPGVFDFYNKLLDGPNKWEWTDAKVGEISVENTFFGGQLGYAVSYFEETVDRGQASLFGGANRIKIDVNEVEIDGTPNPNVGRAYIDEPTFGGSNWEDIDHHALRAQIFGSYNPSERADGGWARFVGRQSINGVYQEDSDERERRNFMLRSVAPDYARIAGSTTGIASTTWRVTPRYYLSGDLRGMGDPSNLGLANVHEYIVPPGGTYSIRYFDRTWAPPPGVNPGDPWNASEQVGWIPINNPQNTYNRQSQNPNNYVGWTDTNFTVVDALDGTQDSFDYAARAANRTKFDVDSIVGVYQGYFLNNALVLTYGWREDQYTSVSVEAPNRFIPGTQNRSSNQGVDVRDPSYQFDSTTAVRVSDTTHTTNWSAVTHLNRLLGDRDFLPLRVTLSYNRGEAFAPVAGRLDGFGNQLPTPAGTTEDIGLLLSTKDDRYSLRVTKYDTEVKLASSPANIDSQMFVLEQAIWNPANTYTRILDGRLDPSTYQPTPGDIPSDWTGTPVEYFSDVIIPSYHDFLNEMYERYPDFVDFWTGTGTLPPALGGPTDGVRVRRPPTHRYTENQRSRGWEFELTANPTRNWRIAINASRAEAIRSDVPDAAFSEILDFIDNAYRNTPAGLMKVNSSLTATGIASNVRNNHWARFWGNVIYLRSLNGQPQPEVRKWRANLITNYMFTENRLRGFGIGGAYRYTSPATIGFPYMDVAGSDPRLDLSSPYRTESENIVDLWVSYARPLSKHVDWRIQLNVYNAFGKNELIPINAQVDGTPGMFRIQEGRSWAITNTFSF